MRVLVGSLGHPARRSRHYGALLVVAALVLGGCESGPETSPYTPPSTRPAADGGTAYVDPPMVDRAVAAALDPQLGSPEAAVVKFLASHVRGDERWRDAIAPASAASAERALATWSEWPLQRFQLRGRDEASGGRMRVRAWFEIVADGATDDGEDEFELALVDGTWRIARPPT